MKRLIISTVLFGLAYLYLLFLPTLGRAETTLTLTGYLRQVEAKNDALLGAEGASRGAELRAEEARLAYSPNLFAHSSYTLDKSPTSAFITRDSQSTKFYQLGVSQGTGFGLTGRLYYNLYDIETKNPNNPLFFNEGGTYWEGKPYIELTQSLWRNGFGSETRAQVELGEANAQATSHSEGYRATLIRTEAERTYWRLAAARLMVRAQRDNLARAEKIRSYQNRRAKLELADRSDFLQSVAAVDLRSLDLQTALDEERIAARAFNLARGIDSDEVKEELQEMRSETILRADPPVRAKEREDVSAARAQVRAAQASARLGLERQNPTLEVYANANLDGRDRRFDPAWSESFRAKHSTTTVGVRFSVPLNAGLLSDARKGYRAEIDAADHNLQRRLLEQESDWKDLSRRLTEAKSRLELALKVEEAQRLKAAHERNRQERGRTTTYQVLMFEQDFALAQTARIRAQFDVLNVLALMKAYGAETL